jgi:transposase InsO family protein
VGAHSDRKCCRTLYYISFTDNFSQETKVRFLKLKSEALSTLKDHEMELRCQTPGAKIKKLHSDRDGEYLSTEFDRYLKDQGIVRGHLSISLPSLLSPPLSYTPLSSPTLTPVHMYTSPLSIPSLGAKP